MSPQAGSIETVHVRPWSTVLRVSFGGSAVWFKACAPVQSFEPRLTTELAGRWPDRVAEVIAHDETRAWLLLADAGTPIRDRGNPPAVLPRYAELQRREAPRASEHLARLVPDLRVGTLPDRYDDLLRSSLPLTSNEFDQLRRFAPRFTELCRELGVREIPETVQHDDLHMGNIFVRGDRVRVLDWGDASISHPFVSLVVTFRFLEEFNKLPRNDPWFARLRDAYLEPWGRNLSDAFVLALRVGVFAHTFGWLRQ